MVKANARAIYCPKTENHPNGKLLLLLHEEGILVHCPDHGWIGVELFSNGKKIDVENSAVKLFSTNPKLHFNLEPQPVVAVGEFRSKRKKYASRSH